MRYYSIAAFSTDSLQIEEPLMLIDPGMNVFTVLTADVDALVELLQAKGVRVDKVNALDGDATHDRDPSQG